MTEKARSILHGCVLLYIPVSFLTPMLMWQLRDNNRMIVMDRENTYFVSKYSSDEQLRREYEFQIRQAVTAFLSRNPNGLDDAGFVSDIFTGDASKIVSEQLDMEKAQFETYSLHQKPEILEIKILRADRIRSYSTVRGQLFRYYENASGQLAYTVSFELSLEMQVNMNTATNGRYPFVVTNMKYTQQAIKEE